jgi:hypothetical protein
MFTGLCSKSACSTALFRLNTCPLVVLQGLVQIGIGIAIGIEIDCCFHEVARNDECKGDGNSDPDSDDAAMGS